MTIAGEPWIGETRSETLSADMSVKLERATQHHVSGHYAAALDIYHEILEQHPNNGLANYNLAILAKQIGNPELCERYLKRSIECAQSIEEVVRRQLELASLLMYQNRFIEADRLMDDAEPYAKGIAEFYEWRGKLKHALERYDDAIAAFETVCQLKPDEGGYWLQLADSMSKSDTENHRADAAISRGVETGIDDPDTLINISSHYINQGRYADAKPHLTNALKVAEKRGQPPDPFNCYYLGNVLRKLGDEEGALAEYARGLEICDLSIESDPKRKDIAHAFKGRILYAMGRKDEARQAAAETGAANPASTHQYPMDQYLSDTPQRIQRFKETVAGRDIALLAHGPSIAALEARIEELADRDIFYVAVNRFSVLESGFLNKIGRGLDAICPTNPTEFQVQGNQIIEFLERDENNMVLSSRYGVGGISKLLPSGLGFCEQFDPKLLLFSTGYQFPTIASHPLHFIPANTPGVLIPMLELGEPRRIYFFGGDGGADLAEGEPSHYRMDTAEFGQELHETTYSRFREKLLVDADVFNEVCEFSVIWTAAFHGIPEAPVYTVSPNSNFKVFPRINYDRALSEIGLPT